MQRTQTTKRLRILILEDVPTDAELVEQELRSAGMEFASLRVDGRDSFLEALERFSPEVILSDYSLPGFDGESALSIALEKVPDVPFIFVTGALGEERAVELLKSGATDFVLKDRLMRLPLCVKRALEEVEEKRRRKQAEKELRLAHAGLERKVAELRMYATMLEQSNRDLEDFAFVASHDLQEPARKIQTIADRLVSLCDGTLHGRALDYLSRMHRSAARMQSLVLDLLEYSRVTSRHDGFALFKLKESVEEAVADLSVLVEQTGGRIEIDPLPEVEADRVQMRRLFQNLIGNSLKYHSGQEPLVKIRAVCADSDCFHEILVEDNGIGFDERYLEKIFKPFQRLHGRNSQYPGTGMGLAICRRIVERHGGTITARSKPGQGATFIVRVPKNSREWNSPHFRKHAVPHKPSTTRLE